MLVLFLNVCWSSAMKPSGPGVFCYGSFSITAKSLVLNDVILVKSFKPSELQYISEMGTC